MNQPLVSFCMSTYKRGTVLTQTLKSIQQQTSQNFEVIITDNDPEQTGKAYVQVLDDARFKYYPNEQNLGMKPSFNRALHLASGEFIVMIADDDPVYPDMLQTLLQLKEQHPGYGMYMGGCDWFCEAHEVARLYKMKVGTNSCLSNQIDLNEIRIYDTSSFLKTLFSFGLFSHYLWSTCMVKKELLIKMGGVPDYGTAFLGDYAYMSISSASNGCVIINKSLGQQTLHKENFGRKQNDQLPILASNFIPFLTEKLGHVNDWDQIRKLITHFFGAWITGHMAFLYQYNKDHHIEDPSFRDAEEKVLQYPAVKPFLTKYKIKKRYPVLHDNIVIVKSLLKKKQ